MEERYAIGVDISARTTMVALGNLRGEILHLLKAPTRTGDKNLLVEQVVSLVKNVMGKLRASARVEGIGIGCAGILDIKKGTIVKAANLGITNLPIRDILSDIFGCRVEMLNDCTSGVLGEKFYGLGREFSNIVYVSIETGIGGGVILDNHLLLGKDGNAAEIGHITIDYNSPLICSCGGRGHWEAHCAESGITNFFKWFVRNLPEEKVRGSKVCSLIDKGVTIRADDIFKAARGGDPVAKEFVDEVGRVNAVGIASIINTYDPELITLGGRLFLDHQDLLFKPLLDHLRDYVTNRPPIIKPTPLNDNTTIYGGLALIFYGVP